MGAAAALGVLFSAPLFGILSVAEEGESIPQEQRKESRSFMLITYGLAMAGGLGVFRMLSEHFGKVMSDFLSFGAVEMTRMDYMMIPVYALAGTLVFILYDLSDKLMIFLTRWIPVPIRELLGGIVLGICGMFIPMLMFSGEAQMEELMAELSNYTPAFLLAICLLKLALTSFCGEVISSRCFLRAHAWAFVSQCRSSERQSLRMRPSQRRSSTQRPWAGL